MPNRKLELTFKYFPASQARRRLGLSRFQFDLRIKRGIFPSPTFTDVTGVRYFDQNWVRIAEEILRSSVSAGPTWKHVETKEEKGQMKNKVILIWLTLVALVQFPFIYRRLWGKTMHAIEQTKQWKFKVGDKWASRRLALGGLSKGGNESVQTPPPLFYFSIPQASDTKWAVAKPE